MRSLFEGSGKTMRHIKIPTLEDVDEKKLVKLIEMVDEKAACRLSQMRAQSSRSRALRTDLTSEKSLNR